MSYYKRHVFFCCNQRAPPEACCNNHGALEIQAYAKQRIKSLRLDGKGRVRINKAGCLDRCNEGPVIVVYPDQSGTPTSASMTSKKSSIRTSYTAESSRGLGFDAR